MDSQIKNLENEIRIYKIKKRHYQENLEIIRTELEKKEKELQVLEIEMLREDFITSNEQLIKDIKNKYNVCDNEINIIYDGMDKYDYKSELKNGSTTPRYIDFDKILAKISSIKSKYAQWQLISVKKGLSQDSFPPTNYYSYEFKDDSNIIFRL